MAELYSEILHILCFLMMKPNFTFFFFFFFCQVSGLTWFTRLDPVKPKEQVFAAEHSPDKMKSDANEMSVITDREQEDVNGKAKHHIRRGDFPSCLHSSNFTTFVSFAAERTLPPPDSSSSVSSVQPPSRFLSALYWLCGMERQKEGQNDPVTPPPPEPSSCFLQEKPRLKLIVNANLIICLSVTAFIIGYWA